MLFGLRAEAQFVDVVDDLAQVVAAVNLVLDLAEDFADLVFDGVRPGGLLLEAVQVGKELLIDEIAQVVAGHGLVVVDLAVLALGRGPGFPAVGLVEDEGVFLAFQRGLVGLVLLQAVEVFQEQEPGGLLGVVEFGGATGLLPETSSMFLKACSNIYVFGSYRRGQIHNKTTPCGAMCLSYSEFAFRAKFGKFEWTIRHIT